MTITSTTRLEKPLHVWLARIIGISIVLVSIGANIAVLPETWHKIQHEGNVQDVWITIQPDGSKTIVYVSSEAAQKGVAVGDILLNAGDTVGEVGTPVTIRFLRDTLPIREATFIRKLSDNTALEGMRLGLSQGTSTALSLSLSLAPFLIGSMAALLICWLKSDDWMAFLTAIVLANVLSLSNTNPYAIVFQLLTVPLIFAWLILFPNGKLAPRWSWVLIFSLLPSNIFYSLLNLGILSYNTLYAGVWQLVDALSGLGGLGIVGVIIFRYKRVFSPVERQQSKWIIFPLLIGITPSIILRFFSTSYWNSYQIEQALLVSFVSAAISAVMTVLIVLGVLVCIFKYRLWDIDFIINRSLVYGALTVLLVIVFGGSLFLVSHIVEGQNFVLAFGVTALLAGGLFNPTRRRIQRFVDQRFYHIHIDYQKTPLDIIPSGSATQVLRTTHFGVYQNLELIGRGGMAEVYKSTHPQLHQPVAIKILPAQLAEEAEFRQRFIREAQVVSQLTHPNIVRVFDSGEQDGKYYMVMEYLTGQDLDKFIRANQCLSLSQALPLIQQIAAALDYAHAQGFVHRDIKPSNVLLDVSNDLPRAILTDFGIAKILNANTAMTRTGSVIGTFDYIAPEQIQESANLDGRADIYALGVMVYQMLTGELPFKHNNPGALLIAHLTQPPPDSCKLLPDLPERICSAIQKAMAKKPEERFATATEFAVEMRKY